MASISRITATRGNLLKLRTSLRFVAGAMEVLKMKRDRLAVELNEQLRDLAQRQKTDKELMSLYADLKVALATLGYSTLLSESLGVPRMQVELTSISVMGAIVPKIRIKEKPSLNSIKDLSLHEIAKRQLELIDKLLHVAQIEASVERIAYELMKVNRKVNALEKVIIPDYERRIRSIENLLYDEELEEYARVKHVKKVLGRKSV